MIKNICVVITISYLLIGCSLLSPVKSNENEYLLTATPHVAKKPGHRHRVLVVSSVESDGIYNTTSMAYTNQQYKISYFANNRWGETPPQMLQSLLIKTLQSTNHFSAVNADISGGSYDYLLNTRLQELQQIFYGNTSVVRLSVRVEILSGVTNKVIAMKQFSSTVPAQATPYGGVVAANRATAEVLGQVARFCLQKI